MKPTIFDNNNYTHNLPVNDEIPPNEFLKQGRKIIHTEIVQKHLQNLPINKVLNLTPPEIDSSETTLDRRTLAQLRSNHSSFLMSYLNKINPTKYTSLLCPACNLINHDTRHLFNCTTLPTTLTPMDLWTHPVETGHFLQKSSLFIEAT